MFTGLHFDFWWMSGDMGEMERLEVEVDRMGGEERRVYGRTKGRGRIE
jgi:hypothetical protein